eukprot:gene28098-31206_t
MAEDLKAKVQALYKSLAGEEGKRWARPQEPILHNMVDEKEEPHVFFHNTNYRISRKYINAEKIRILKQEALECVRSNGHARYHKCTEIHKRLQAMVRVFSNVDRGALARKRDVGFIYHNNRMKELQKEAAELEGDKMEQQQKVVSSIFSSYCRSTLRLKQSTRCLAVSCRVLMKVPLQFDNMTEPYARIQTLLAEPRLSTKEINKFVKETRLWSHDDLQGLIDKGIVDVCSSLVEEDPSESSQWEILHIVVGLLGRSAHAKTARAELVPKLTNVLLNGMKQATGVAQIALMQKKGGVLAVLCFDAEPSDLYWVQLLAKSCKEALDEDVPKGASAKSRVVLEVGTT